MAAPKRSTHKSRVRLNLLYPQGTSQRLPVKFIKWLIAYGRFIVIAVEIVVVAAFLYRFQLDAKLADIKKDINNHIPFIKAQAADEIGLRRFQDKLTSIKGSYAISPKISDVLDQISQQLPPGVTLRNISIDHQKPIPTVDFKISGIAAGNSDLALMMKGLLGVEMFKGVELASVGFDEGALTFTVVGSTK